MVKHSLVKSGANFNVIATIDTKELASRANGSAEEIKNINAKIAEIEAQINNAKAVIEALKTELNYNEWFVNSTVKILKR